MKFKCINRHFLEIFALGSFSCKNTLQNEAHLLVWQALKAIILLDAVGLVLGWRVFDHAAHLGGVLFGM